MKLKSGSLGSKSARKALRRRSAIALFAGTMLVTSDRPLSQPTPLG